MSIGAVRDDNATGSPARITVLRGPFGPTAGGMVPSWWSGRGMTSLGFEPARLLQVEILAGVAERTGR